MDGLICIFKTEDGSLIQRIEGPDEVTFLEWHPKGYVLIAGGADGTLWMWKALKGEVMQVFAGHIGPVSCGHFSSDGKTILSGSEDNTFFLWNPKNGTPIFHLQTDKFHRGPVTCIDVHKNPDHPLVMTGSEDGTARIIHLHKAKTILNLKGHGAGVEAVGFSST